uniref:11-beta-hydroxysteroid dehydrogenase 1 n=1 Tax=Bubo bubo TaxID=30461 RepID=A0A8C0FGY8_BUBBB
MFAKSQEVQRKGPTDTGKLVQDKNHFKTAIAPSPICNLLTHPPPRSQRRRLPHSCLCFCGGMGLLLKIFIPLLGLCPRVGALPALNSVPSSPEMLRGKRVIVTGASSGIGEQVAYHLARMEAHLLLTARTEAKLQKVNGKQSVSAAPWRTPRSPERALLAGGLDMLILNHIGYSYFNYFNGDVGQVRKLLETNFLSYVAMTVSALPMLKESEGSIVVVSSVAGKIGSPFAASYSATKFALEGFFSSLRHEFIIDKVNVSITLCILGYINTENAVRAISHVIRSTPAPKEECALEIIRSGALRQRELHYPPGAVGSLLLLRNIAPDLLDSFIRSNYEVENIRRT